MTEGAGGAVPPLRTELGVVLRLRERRASRPFPFPFVARAGMVVDGGRSRLLESVC